MDELYTRFDSTFFEKTRLSMLTLVYREGQIPFTRLRELIGGTDGAIYTHLEKLLKAGYVTKRKVVVMGPEGPSVQTVYAITPEGSKTFREYLDFLELMIASAKRGEEESPRKEIQ